MSVVRLDIKNSFAAKDLSACLLKRFGKDIPTIVCLGSDKVLSDMVGVLVADKLRSLGVPVKVFGGSSGAIGAANLDILLAKLKTKNILFVDSTACKTPRSIYYSSRGITLKNGKFYNGASIGAGTIFVNDNKVFLAKTSYLLVFEYANKIVDAICNYVYFAKLLNNCK